MLTQNWYWRNWVIVVTKPEHMVFMSLELFFGKNLEEIEDMG
jgi:hypothetical protein